MRRLPLPALLSLVVAAPALGACSGTGQPEVAYQAFAAAKAPATIQAGDWSVTLDEASVAFGPVYFCAASSGSADLCETAVGELTEIGTTIAGRRAQPCWRAAARVAIMVLVLPRPTSKNSPPPWFASSRRAPEA